jgi:hypothetical protein
MPRHQRGKRKAARQIASESGVCAMTVRRHVLKMKEGMPVKKNCPGMKHYCHDKYKGIKPDIMWLFSQSKAAEDVRAIFDLPEKTLYRWRAERAVN